MGVLFFAALLPRLTAVSRYITPDELAWVYRSVLFREALLDGRWLDTFTTGHPGILTTWLGAVAISLQLLINPSSADITQWISHIAWLAPDNITAFQQAATFLSAGRIAIALANSLGIVFICWLTQRLWGTPTALLAGFLLAFDPFLVGLSGLLHVDSLMTTFTTISLLALALTISHTAVPTRQPGRYALLSGAAAGLALLAKSPALLLPPFAALILLLSLLRPYQIRPYPPHPFRPRLLHTIQYGLLWIAAWAGALLLLFPALWNSPTAVATQIRTVATQIRTVATEHIENPMHPSFFLGAFGYEHGPLFYPVTLAFRLSPVVFIGGLLATILIIRAIWRHKDRIRWLALSTWIFLLWPLLYLVLITFAAKKFDRYALPIIPALILMAALAWVHFPYLRGTLRRVTLPLLVAIQALYLAWALPYPLTAVNPLLGGTAVARHVMELDWGEGIGAAAHWLATQDDATNRTAVSGIAPALAPFFPGQTLTLTPENLAQAHYIITTIDSGNLQPAPPIAGAVPLHTIRFNGHDRALIFQANPTTTASPPTPINEPTQFGQAVALTAAATTATPQEAQLALQWQLVQPTNGRFTIKLDLLDAQGTSRTSHEQPLLNDVYFYPEHWPANSAPIVPYRLILPPGLPPGTYTPTISLFAADGAQLPVLDGDGRLRGISHPLNPLTIQPSPTTNPDLITSAQPHNSQWLDGALRLLGQDSLPTTVLTGDTLPIGLIWQAERPLPANLQLQFTLNGQEIARLPLSSYPSAQWQSGQIIHEQYHLPIPPNLAGGDYTLAVQPLPATTATNLGQVAIQEMQRDFTMPNANRLEQPIPFADGLVLQGYNLAATTLTPGATLPLTLYWYTNSQPTDLYTAFVHLIGPDGQTIAQSDQWPGGLPTTLRVPGEYIRDEVTIQLPTDLPAGEYTFAIGLYNAANGLRQPILTPPSNDDRAILPVTLTPAP
jgi:4-amino-4-deoxy-L-arabinose transferase-like glycosyltransferase